VTAARVAPPASRNAPCPCGSGQRYKDCHGVLGAPAASADTLLAQAEQAYAAGELVTARRLLERALALAPERADLLRERARIEWTLGDPAAAATCRAALARAPADVAAWNLLGEILNPTDPPGAGAAWWQALSLDPDNAEASFHLGNHNREQGEFDAAIIHYERALRRAPGHSGVLNNLGLALEATGQADRAENCYREVLAREPQHADALANLANILFAREAIEETVAVFEQLVAVRPDLPAPMWMRRAIAQDRGQDARGAEQSFLEAQRRAPDSLQVSIDLSSFYVRHGRFADAENALQRALELDPGNPYALSLRVHAHQQRCLWAGLQPMIEQIRALLEAEATPTEYPVAPFYVLALPLSPGCQLHAAQRWARAPAAAPAPPALAVAAGERLRVAFVSANFREHPTAHLSLEFWEKIDRTRLEMFAYSLGSAAPDACRRRAQAAFEHFVDVDGLTVAEIAQRIRADRIAIVIDRNGYTQHAREGIFALRPAPLQINCIGYPGTLGAPWYDYIFTDRFSLPESLRPFYSEQPLYMPHMAFPSDTTRLPPGPPPDRAACGLPAAGFVFCCFNNAYKILPDVFALWMRLLAAVPGSVLWLLETTAEATANLRREAQAAGIAPERLIFAPRVSVGAHVARHAAADLFLDTYPYGAHTTANDALLAGLPLITCVGETLVSRIAGSQLAAIGLPELITTNLADYETLARTLAREPALLKGYRDRLAANRRTHPLFDMDRYASDFATAMTQIWAAHAGGASV
jgi:protein O-GlcNAc transferase